MRVLRLISAGFLYSLPVIAIVSTVTACSYSFKSTVDYAAYNSGYEESVRNSGVFFLNSDLRVKEVLAGADAASLQSSLDSISALKDRVDGVALAVSIHGLLSLDSTTSGNISSRLKSLVIILEASLSSDNASAISALVTDGAAADAARSAMQSYAASTNNETALAMVKAYALALDNSWATLAASAPILSSLIYSSSTQAVSGSGNINTTNENLAKAEDGATTGDTETEVQIAGLALTGQLMIQATAIRELAETSALSEAFKQEALRELLKSAVVAGEGRVQVTAVVMTRVLLSSMSSTTTAAELQAIGSKVTASLNDLFTIQAIAQSLITSSVDQTKKDALLGLIAKQNQLFSLVNDGTELISFSDAVVALALEIKANASAVDTVIEKLTNSNNSLGSTVSGGGGGTSGGNTGTCGGSPYFIGTSIASNGTITPGYWRDSAWTSLPIKTGATTGRVFAISCLNGAVYIAGYQVVNTVTQPGYWRDGVWNDLPVLSPTEGASVSSMIVRGSDIYIAGYSKLSSNSIPGYWKNGVWTTLTIPGANSTGGAISMAFASNGDFYITGASGSGVTTPGYWLNGVWNDLSLTGATAGQTNNAIGILLDGNSVYIGGYTTISSNFTAVIWTDNVLGAQAFPAGKVFCNAGGIAKFGGDIYLSGTCRDSQPVFQPFYWKNGSAVSLPLLDATKAGGITSTVVYKNELYFLGSSTNSSNVAVPGYWKNDVWTGFTGLDSSRNSFVFGVGP